MDQENLFDEVMAYELERIASSAHPSFEQIAATAKTSEEKRLKSGSKLVRNEGRMFNEKIVFLNKSTTKYAVIGIHPLTFKPHMKICDRRSGSFFPVTMDEFAIFIHRAKCMLNHMVIETPPKVYEIYTQPHAKNVWKFHSVDGNSATLHRISLGNLVQVEDCIFRELKQRLFAGTAYKDMMKSFRFNTVDFDERKILEHLNTVREQADFTSVEYQLAFDLICNRDYWLTLEEYNEGFFRRVSF